MHIFEFMQVIGYISKYWILVQSDFWFKLLWNQPWPRLQYVCGKTWGINLTHTHTHTFPPSGASVWLHLEVFDWSCLSSLLTSMCPVQVRCVDTCLGSAHSKSPVNNIIQRWSACSHVIVCFIISCSGIQTNLTVLESN